MIDFDAISGVAGVAAAFEVPCADDETAVAACSGSAVRGFSGVGAIVATGDAAGAVATGDAAGAVATGDATGAGPGFCGAG
jgi:hypothetical protein